MQFNADGTEHPRNGEEYKCRLRWALDDGKYPPHVPRQPKEQDMVIIRRRVGDLEERSDQTPEKIRPASRAEADVRSGPAGAARFLTMAQVRLVKNSISRSSSHAQRKMIYRWPL